MHSLSELTLNIVLSFHYALLLDVRFVYVGHASDRMKVENLYTPMLILYEFKVGIFWVEDFRSKEIWTILEEI